MIEFMTLYSCNSLKQAGGEDIAENKYKSCMANYA